MIKNKFDLKGKTAIIIGGRGYLGRNFCEGLAEFGARVYSADLPVESQASKGAKPLKTHKNIVQRQVNVKDRHSVKALVDEVIKKHKKIDVLVFSVSTKPTDFYKPYTECSLEGWQKVVGTELDGMFVCTQEVGKHMEKAKKGSIILLSSIYGIVGNDQRIYEGSNLADVYGDDKTEKPKKIFTHASYAAAKGAHISMARYLAAYWGSYGIRVNCLSPGGVRHKGENETFVKNYCYRVPLGRKAEIDDVTSALIYLSSDAAAYVTGQNLIVDGGWTAW
jgi:NAD(P)-dependent dehydrogenase (short-subunit alcohol dehydrogenase family)